MCKTCGYIFDTAVIGAEHRFDGEWSYNDLGHWQKCSCGEEPDAITSHDDGKWITVTEADVHKEGLKELRCTCGYVLDSETIPEKHDYSSEWTSDETGHWHACSCGEIAGKAAHDKGEWVTVKEATKDEEGLKELRCTVCGHVLDSETIPVVSTGMLGDINDNGIIDSMDYVLLKRAYFGTYKIPEEIFWRGDINGNGIIDSMDYVLLKRAYFGTYKLV